MLAPSTTVQCVSKIGIIFMNFGWGIHSRRTASSNVHPKLNIATFLMLVKANHLDQEIIFSYLLIYIKRSNTNISWPTSRYIFLVSYDPHHILDIRPSPGSRYLIFKSLDPNQEVWFKNLFIHINAINSHISCSTLRLTHEVFYSTSHTKWCCDGSKVGD